MNLKLKKAAAAILLVAFILSFAVGVQAAGAGISVSASSPTVGDTVTVKVTFSGDNMGSAEATLSYNSSILQYVGGSNSHDLGGTVKLVTVADAPGQSSIGASAKFKALQPGTAGFSLSTIELIDWEEKHLGTPSASASLTVVAANTGGSTTAPATTAPAKTKAPTKSSVPKESGGTQEPSPSPSETPPVIPATVGAEEKQVVDFPVESLPQTFSKAAMQYGEHEVACAQNGKYTLLYLADMQGQNGAFYLYREDGSFCRYVELTVQAGVFLFHETQTPPEGFQEAELMIGEIPVQAWQYEGEEEGCYLVYASHPDQDPAFYMLDTQDGSMQRYVDRVRVEQIEVEKEVYIEQEPQEPAQVGFLQRIFDDREVCIFVAALLGAVVLLVVLLIVSGAKRRKLKKQFATLPADTQEKAPNSEKKGTSNDKFKGMH